MKNPLEYPIGIWTIPEVAFVGRTKQRALDDGWQSVGEGVAEYSGSIRGKVQGVSIGILKIVFSKPDGVILGVHILGDDACELIHYGTALAQAGKTVWDVTGTVFTAVTFHELFATAALDAVAQLEKDAWATALDKLGVDASGCVLETKLRTLLVNVGIDAQDIEEILKDIQKQCTKNDLPPMEYNAVLSVVKKYRIPQAAQTPASTSRPTPNMFNPLAKWMEGAAA